MLAVLEQHDGKLHKSALEALAAAQQIGTKLDLPVFAAVLGSGVEPVAQALTEYNLKKIHAVDHELLGEYTPDGYTIALRQLIEAHLPKYVILPHTYQVRDFAPKLATALGVPSPPAWSGSVFDRVWVISYSNGTASLANDAQMLLYGDSSS